MKIDANGTEIRVMGDVVNEDAYISLTDIAKYKNPDNAFIVVANWMRNHSTISFLGLWEQIHNPNFKPIEFDRFKAESGDNAFTLTPQQWIKATDAIGIVSKSGRYGGTYAHTDIAFEFASWIFPEFKLYIIKDYQRLKKDEADRLAIGWVLNAAEEYGLPKPRFQEFDNMFRVELFRVNPITDQANQATNQATNQANQDLERLDQVEDENVLSEKEIEILNLVRMQPSITQKEMANALDWNLASVKYYITKLKEKNYLKRQGSSQKWKWVILTKRD